MSEESINRNDNVQGDGRDAAEIVGDSLNEGVNKIKAGAKAVAKKIDDPDKDIGTEYNKEKPINRNDDVQGDGRDAAEIVGDSLNEGVNKIKAGAKAVAKKIDDPDKDIGTEYNKEKPINRNDDVQGDGRDAAEIVGDSLNEGVNKIKAGAKAVAKKIDDPDKDIGTEYNKEKPINRNDDVQGDGRDAAEIVGDSLNEGVNKIKAGAKAVAKKIDDPDKDIGTEYNKEKPINRNDDVQGDGRDAAEIVGDSLNEGVNKIKAGAKAVAKKIDDPDKDIGTEYNKEKPINRNDDVQGDGRDAAEIVGDSLNEGVNKIKAGAKAVAKKIDDPDKDIGTEYNKEKPINRNNDVQGDGRDAAEIVGDSLNEGVDKIKAGAKAVAKKIDDPDKDIGTEYNKEKIKEQA